MKSIEKSLAHHFGGGDIEKGAAMLQKEIEALRAEIAAAGGREAWSKKIEQEKNKTPITEEDYDYYRDAYRHDAVGGGTSWEKARDEGWRDASQGKEMNIKYQREDGTWNSAYKDSYDMGKKNIYEQRGKIMKITKEQLKQIIKEEIVLAQEERTRPETDTRSSVTLFFDQVEAMAANIENAISREEAVAVVKKIGRLAAMIRPQLDA